MASKTYPSGISLSWLAEGVNFEMEAAQVSKVKQKTLDLLVWSLLQISMGAALGTF